MMLASFIMHASDVGTTVLALPSCSRAHRKSVSIVSMVFVLLQRMSLPSQQTLQDGREAVGAVVYRYLLRILHLSVRSNHDDISGISP